MSISREDHFIMKKLSPEARAHVNRSNGRSDEALDVASESALAHHFEQRFDGQFLYNHTRGAWLHWCGSHWKLEATQLVTHKLHNLAIEIAGADKAKLKSCGKSAFIKGAEALARTLRTFARVSSDFDRDHYLLATPDGTVDLRTGDIKQADPSDMITRCTAAGPAQSVECPRWLKFVTEALGGDDEMQRAVQQWSGYVLTGDTREQKLLFAHGPGGNGKSVYTNTITRLLGNYATTTAMETLTASKGEKHPTDLADLCGARLVTSSETERGRAWSETRIKNLTGSDPIKARFMRQDFFQYVPEFKLLIIGNNLPQVSSVDDAMKRRLCIAPFINKPAAPDQNLESKLQLEFPGILRWAIEGCLDWQRNGLIRPAAMEAATAAYFENQDMLGSWISEKCEITQSQRDWTSTMELFDSWTKYARANGEETGSKRAFSDSFQARGFTRKALKNGRGFLGIRIRFEYADDEEANEYARA